MPLLPVFADESIVFFMRLLKRVSFLFELNFESTLGEICLALSNFLTKAHLVSIPVCTGETSLLSIAFLVLDSTFYRIVAVLGRIGFVFNV